MSGIISYGDRAAREVSERIGGTVANTTAIQALTALQRADGMVVVDAATGIPWVYSGASAAAASRIVLVPADAPAAGRWLAAVATVSADSARPGATMTGAGAVGVIGVPVVIYAPITAGITGAADDVTITTSVPYAAQILRIEAVVTTVGAGDTWTLRDTVGGAGTALSDAISVAVAGVIPWGVTALPAAVAAGSDIYVRRTDDTTDGAVVITLLPV